LKQCYFCKITKGLKAIYLEDDIEDGNSEKGRCCCRQCYHDNELENYEENYKNWFLTDYHWQTKEERMKDRLKTKTALHKEVQGGIDDTK
jgi:hypothetical protein